RRIGFWQNQPLLPEQMGFTQAFAMDTMTFTQWLQFVFLPRVREAAASNQFPSNSSVGTQAVREFDGDPEAGDLVTLLSEFDALLDTPATVAIRITSSQKKRAALVGPPAWFFLLIFGQKLILAPSCTMRASRAPVTWPKVLLGLKVKLVFSVV